LFAESRTGSDQGRVQQLTAYVRQVIILLDNFHPYPVENGNGCRQAIQAIRAAYQSINQSINQSEED